MTFYHFTSLENWEIIREIQSRTIICTMTIQEDRRQQLWAMGEHKGKAEVRLTMVSRDYKEIPLPADKNILFEMVRVGAVTNKGLTWDNDDDEDKPYGYEEPKLWGITGRSVDDEYFFNYYEGEGLMNWVCGSGYIVKAEVWNEKSRRYTPMSIPMTPEEKIEDIHQRLRTNHETYWYIKRWNDYYEERLKELKK